MQNTLLVVLREMKRLTPAIVAQKLNIDLDIYNQIERGDLLMDYQLAKEIGRLYKIKFENIYESARQLDSLLAQNILVKTLESRLGDVGVGGSLKEICDKAIKVYNDTDILLVKVNDMMQNWNDGSAKMLEHINASIERSNMITEKGNAIIKQTEEVYQLVNRHIKETNDSFEATYENCKQSVKDVSAMNDDLSKENDELKRRLGK